MYGPISYKNLKVIGYGEVEIPETVPTFEQPIYEIEGARGDVLYAMRLLDKGVVGEVSAMDRFKRSVRRGDCTLLNRSYDAKQGHTLWVDENMEPHYGRYDAVIKRFEKMYYEYLEKGDASLRERDFDEARLAFQRAFTINTDSVEAHSGIKAVDFYLEPEKRSQRKYWDFIEHLHSKCDVNVADIAVMVMDRIGELKLAE